ncbi:MAG: hypothetical protein WBO46_04000 [Caldilineaceae bacterium]
MTADSMLANKSPTTAYDANGNLTGAYSYGWNVASYTWNAENRLAYAYRNGVTESYAYDADGNRIKKTSGSLVTRTFFPHYEEEQVTVWPYTTTAVKHYSFNGQPIAISKGGVLSYVHADHLGSSSVETNTSGVESASRTYYA